jgi:hypothetical protein
LDRIKRSDMEAALAANPGNRIFAEALHRMQGVDHFLCVLGRYIHFNSIFASSVTSLAGEIAARQDLFRDADEPVGIIADRSTEVAADIFFAAIDEFGGHITNHRKTHRALAQAMLKTSGTFFGFDPAQINNTVNLNESTCAAIHRVREGYGVNQVMDHHKLFSAIGFHLGSEALADQEFRILDNFLRAEQPDLVEHLESTDVNIGGARYSAYYWVRIHTSVEARHFAVAAKGANRALRYYVGLERKSRIKDCIIQGARDFTVVQTDFMAGL